MPVGIKSGFWGLWHWWWHWLLKCRWWKLCELVVGLCVLHTSEEADNSSGEALAHVLITRFRKHNYKVYWILSLGLLAPHSSFFHTTVYCGLQSKGLGFRNKANTLYQEAKQIVWVEVTWFGEKEGWSVWMVNWARTEVEVITAKSRQSGVSHPQIDIS